MRVKYPLYILITFGLFKCTFIQAQEVVFPKISTLSIDMYTTDYKGNTASNGLEWVQVPSGSRLVKTYETESPFGTHTTYHQYIGDKRILFAGVKVHQSKKTGGSIQNFLYTGTATIASESNLLMPTNQGLVPVYKREKKTNLHPQVEYTTANGLVLWSSDKLRYDKRDTTLFSKVFMVNPINSADTSYGGNFVDNNNATNSTLDSQLFWVTNTAKVENGVYYLESEFLSFEDISSPIDPPFSLTNDTADFNRSDREFEFLNIYHHINKVGEYVNALGYDALTQPLKVDAHSFGSTGDNSAYDPENHTLQFGDGGVDDGEDGEVIIHEFTHSLSEIASPDNTEGRERSAMEEGICDYFAKAYSRSINDNTPNQVFSWDGHNPFWDGFGINTGRVYPKDLKNSKDGDRDMWSSALMCGHDFIGRLAMDSLVMEHLYYQGANTTMPQMARVILDIDNADFDGRYQSELKECFVQAGFIERGASISKVKNSPFTVLNQSAFVLGEANLIIETPAIVNAQVYDVMGRKVYTINNERDIVLHPSLFTTGMYVVYIEMGNSHFTQKIVR